PAAGVSDSAAALLRRRGGLNQRRLVRRPAGRGVYPRRRPGHGAHVAVGNQLAAAVQPQPARAGQTQGGRRARRPHRRPAAPWLVPGYLVSSESMSFCEELPMSAPFRRLIALATLAAIAFLAQAETRGQVLTKKDQADFTLTPEQRGEVLDGLLKQL